MNGRARRDGSASSSLARGCSTRKVASLPRRRRPTSISPAAAFLEAGNVQAVRHITLVGVSAHACQDQDRRSAPREVEKRSRVIQLSRQPHRHSLGDQHQRVNAAAFCRTRCAHRLFRRVVTGLFVVAPRADLKRSRQRGENLDASLDADIEISGKPARIIAELTLPPKKGPVSAHPLP